jgi:hypothetical protein
MSIYINNLRNKIICFAREAIWANCNGFPRLGGEPKMTPKSMIFPKSLFKSLFPFRGAKKCQNGHQNGFQIKQKSKTNVDEKQHDFGTVFLMDFDDFRPYLESIFEYFLSIYKKSEKASKRLFLVCFFMVCASPNHPKFILRSSHTILKPSPNCSNAMPK